jgi:membrane-bound lytic murein transglycosylase D
MKTTILRINLVVILLFLTGASSWAGPQEVSPAPASPPFLAFLKIEGPLEFCGEAVPIGEPEVRERLEKELILTLGNQAQVVLWLKRSGRYMPYIEETLRAGGLPDDLKYMVIAESALQPHAGSSKGATGYWQFMEATGRNYGLRITPERDERRNIFSSTEAAIRYLKKLHKDLGSWTLAAAAYNMGEEGLKAEILVQKVDNYYHLYLPLETQQYLFRIIAAKLIASNPEKYGFKLAKKDLYPPLEFDLVEIDCPTDVPLSVVAGAAGTRFKVVKDLNPEIRGYYLSRGRQVLRVPRGSAPGFEIRFEDLLRRWLQETRTHTYEVKTGDSLSSVAERFHVPLPALLIWNRLNSRKTITPGDRLIVLPGGIKPSRDPSEKQ